MSISHVQGQLQAETSYQLLTLQRTISRLEIDQETFVNPRWYPQEISEEEEVKQYAEEQDQRIKEIEELLPKTAKNIEALIKNSKKESFIAPLMQEQLKELQKSYYVLLEKNKHIHAVKKITSPIFKLDVPFDTSLPALKQLKQNIRPLFQQISQLNIPYFSNTLNQAKIHLIDMESRRKERKDDLVKKTLTDIYQAAKYFSEGNKFSKEEIEKLKKTFFDLPKKLREHIGGEVWNLAGGKKIDTKGDLHWGENHAFDAENLPHLVKALTTIEGFIPPYFNYYNLDEQFKDLIQFPNNEEEIKFEGEVIHTSQQQQPVQKHPQEEQLKAVLNAIEILRPVTQDPEDFKDQLKPLLDNVETSVRTKIYEALYVEVSKTQKINEWGYAENKFHLHVNVLEAVIKKELNLQ